MALIATALVEEARPARRPVMDVAGVALFTAGVSALLLGIVQAGGAGGLAGAPPLSPPPLRPTRALVFVGGGGPAARPDRAPPPLRRPLGIPPPLPPLPP